VRPTINEGHVSEAEAERTTAPRINPNHADALTFLAELRVSQGRSDEAIDTVAENINPSYVSRVLRLTLLAAEIVETLMAARAEDAQSLDGLMKPFPIEWQMHRSLVGPDDGGLVI
jgi:hypothetical protein